MARKRIASPDDKFYPGYTQLKEEWHNNGCLPPDEAKDRLAKLAADVESGRIEESERNRIATNAEYMRRTGGITERMHRMVLEAVKVDENGDLLDLE